jgi:hypothetical protein
MTTQSITKVKYMWSYASIPPYFIPWRLIEHIDIAIFLPYFLTYLGHSWETANCAATQEVPSILWKPKVHYRVHKNSPLLPMLNQIDPMRTIPSYLSKIHFNIVHPAFLPNRL